MDARFGSCITAMARSPMPRAESVAEHGVVARRSSDPRCRTMKAREYIGESKVSFGSSAVFDHYRVCFLPIIFVFTTSILLLVSLPVLFPFTLSAETTGCSSSFSDSHHHEAHHHLHTHLRHPCYRRARLLRPSSTTSTALSTTSSVAASLMKLRWKPVAFSASPPPSES